MVLVVCILLISKHFCTIEQRFHGLSREKDYFSRLAAILINRLFEREGAYFFALLCPNEPRIQTGTSFFILVLSE